MTSYDGRSTVKTLGAPSLWVCTLPGIVFIAAGNLALSDVVFATIISVELIGLTSTRPFQNSPLVGDQGQ